MLTHLIKQKGLLWQEQFIPLTNKSSELPEKLYPEATILYQKSKEHPYVSRGGLKLAHALQEFSIDLQEKIVLDIGSSTGGFTDVSLRAGAKRVYALDVGTNQLAWKLRNDERVTVMEQTTSAIVSRGILFMVFLNLPVRTCRFRFN